MSSDPIEVLRSLRGRLGIDADGPFFPGGRGRSERVAVVDAALDAALASLSAPKRHERPKGNSPIEELLGEYEADGCDHSDLHWVRAAARRYVETMEDSQIRCLLHVLSAHKSGSNMDAASPLSGGGFAFQLATRGFPTPSPAPACRTSQTAPRRQGPR